MVVSLLLVGAGLAALLVGGTAVVSRSVSLAHRLGISAAVIGLTVVAFGTSAPEMAVSVLASVQGNPGIVVGNVFGSNIFNILVAIGAAACIAPVVLEPAVLRREVPICIAANLVVLVFAITGGRINTWEGFDLVVALFIFLIWCVRKAKKNPEEPSESDSERAPLAAILFTVGTTLVLSQTDSGWDWGIAGLLIGTILVWLLEPDPQSEQPPLSATLWLYLAAAISILITGAELLVRGATDIGVSLGISEPVIGLTVVAIGTSAPELATSIVAAKRGELGLAVGNALGSNLFNLLGVLGLAALVRAVPVELRFVTIDGWLALGSVVLLPIMARRAGVLERRHGTLMVGLWLAYTLSLVVIALT
ncbi:MAG: calcium/sodium antiporter [Myxococcota bacterium]|nr:calcium/sodium antiporter [Myxococcota bacterium]